MGTISAVFDNLNQSRGVLPALLNFIVLLQLLCVSANASAPDQAIEAGYTKLTFISYFNDDIDISNTQKSGYNWYLKRFFGYPPTDTSYIGFNSDGNFVINPKRKANYGVATAAPVKKPKKWVGTAFGGGGYFEAEIKFDPSTSLKPRMDGWPSFWSMSIEHMANLKEEHWKGQPLDFVHFIEVDFFEYYIRKTEGISVYIANMHDWFGSFKRTCPETAFCKNSLPYREAKRITPKDTDFSEYHKFGFLWVQATKKSNGSGTFFFDGKQIGPKVQWNFYEDQPPSDIPTPWTFGIIDSQHLVLILGTGRDQPMTVRKVSVWQKSAIDNLVQ